VCLIVDANVAGRFLAQPGAIVDWLFGDRGIPRLVAAGKLREELAVLTEVRRLLVTLERAGRLRSADPHRLQTEEARLRIANRCVSNDHHVLALALVTGARTLATDDGALARDFKNVHLIAAPRGKIYRDPGIHGRLLGHTPKSCGISPGNTGPRRRHR
jgi:hypothetical protein